MKAHAIEPEFVADIAKFAELKNKLVAKRSEYVGFRDFYERRVMEIDGQLAQAGVYLTDVCAEAADLPPQPAAKEVKLDRKSFTSQVFVVLGHTVGDRALGMTISEIIAEVRKTMPKVTRSAVSIALHSWRRKGFIERVNREHLGGRFILTVPVKLVFRHN